MSGSRIVHEGNLRKWLLLRGGRLYWRWPWERPVSDSVVAYLEEMERRDREREAAS